VRAKALPQFMEASTRLKSEGLFCTERGIYPDVIRDKSLSIIHVNRVHLRLSASQKRLCN
jgi:hypothetical protein